MAKKKPTSRTDAVRQAVDQAFQTQIPRERIGELLDELGHTAGRLRGAVDELRPASVEDIKSLRAELAALTERIASLEAAPKPKPTPRRPAAAKAAASKRAATPAKPRKTAATRSAPSASAAKPRKAAAKPKSTES